MASERHAFYEWGLCVPSDFFGLGDGDEDLLFAQDTSLAGQFVQPWKLRTRAQEATLKEAADGKIRRLLARNETFNCAEIDVGDIVLFYKAQNRESLQIDESGVIPLN